MQHWPSEATPPETVTLDAIWGGEPRGSLAARALDAQSCAVLAPTWNTNLRMRFPVATQPLYPVFIDAVRRTMGRIVQRSHELEGAVSLDEAKALFDIGWTAAEVSDHPHHVSLLAHGTRLRSGVRPRVSA